MRGNLLSLAATLHGGRSLVGQQEWMYWPMREAAQSMRRGGIDLLSAGWTPPWEYVPDPNPSPDNPHRYGYVPA
eukprot:3449737-Pyramimonas_sp.AAC.1